MKKTKMIRLTLLLTCVMCLQQAEAQDNARVAPLKTVDHDTYKNAIGLRAGETSGLTYKHFIDQGSAIEAILGFWPNALSITALYERHATAFNTGGFNWYYGAGGHAAFETDRYYDDRRRYRRGDDLGIGVDGILGLEYKIHPIPFAVSLDLKPFIEFNTNGRIYTALDPGLGVKFTF